MRLVILPWLIMFGLTGGVTELELIKDAVSPVLARGIPRVDLCLFQCLENHFIAPEQFNSEIGLSNFGNSSL